MSGEACGPSNGALVKQGDNCWWQRTDVNLTCEYSGPTPFWIIRYDNLMGENCEYVAVFAQYPTGIYYANPFSDDCGGVCDEVTVTTF